MKKKVILAMCIAAALALAGCGNKNEAAKTDDGQEEAESFLNLYWNELERKRKADPDRDGNLFLDPGSSCGCYGAGVNRGDVEHAGIYEG